MTTASIFFVGTRAYDKLQGIIMKKSILNDVKRLSPDAQTSSLEGFIPLSTSSPQNDLFFMAWNILQVI